MKPVVFFHQPHLDAFLESFITNKAWQLHQILQRHENYYNGEFCLHSEEIPKQMIF
jgi:hypothetical protein